MAQLQSPPPKPKTPLGRKVENFFITISDPIDVIGSKVFGDLWRQLYMAVQDAIALAFLLKVPGAVGALVVGKDFTGWDVCMKLNPYSVEFFACFIIVASDFSLWVLLLGRMLGRFLSEWRVK
jgi:hypothetical protein